MAIGSLGWAAWAALSAFFAALTAILAKVGVNAIDPDLATFIRTVVILLMLGGILMVGGQWREAGAIQGRSMLFLVLSGLATGASWLCYFRALKLGDASRVAPVDKMSVVLVAVFGVAFLGEKLARIHWLGLGLVALGVFLLTRKG
jgi:transporter family protein